MADLAKIVEDLSSLTVLEAAELSKMLEEKPQLRSPLPPLAALPVVPLSPKKRRPSSTSS
jgi:ribosomal protein L7/L12